MKSALAPENSISKLLGIEISRRGLACNDRAGAPHRTRTVLSSEIWLKKPAGKSFRIEILREFRDVNLRQANCNQRCAEGKS